MHITIEQPPFDPTSKDAVTVASIELAKSIATLIKVCVTAAAYQTADQVVRQFDRQNGE